MADKKQQRFVFTPGHWEILQNIVIHGDEGRFLRVLRVRDTSTNLTKAEVWDNITNIFNEVCIVSLDSDSVHCIMKRF
jgi:hypothetical protein